MEEKIKEILEELRPILQSDGGDIEFVKYAENYLYVKLFGACQGCPHRSQTITYGILESIRSVVPEVEDIIIVDL